jgi:hypothetical protein
MKLTTKARKAIPAKDFAGPHRSYPIENPSHARNALARASGKPVEAEVRAKVHKKYPSIGKSVVPRGEHHKANHREPRTHQEFHQLGNSQNGTGESDEYANRSTQVGVAVN